MSRSPIVRSVALRRGLILAIHQALTAVAFYAAFALRFDFAVPPIEAHHYWQTLLYLLGVRLATMVWFRLDRGYWRHFGARDSLRLLGATAVGSLVLFTMVRFDIAGLAGVPRSVLAIEGLLTLALSAGVRLLTRFFREWMRTRSALDFHRAFVIGAGDAGERILRHLLHDPAARFEAVGLIDDAAEKRGSVLHGVRVLGTADELRGLSSLHRVTHALVAIPSATTEQLKRLVERCVDAGLEVRILPPFKDLVRDRITVHQLREVQIEDLLGRQPVSLDLEAIRPDLAGRVIVVTGAGGSIGAELARQIAPFNPRELVLVDRAESSLNTIHLELSRVHHAVRVVPVLASVTNADRLRGVFEAHPPDIVFHAAAYKHVPMLEWNMVEGVWNNVIGTLRLARCAALAGARKFVLISTDKAVNPSSILGATKFVAERVALELPSLQGTTTDFRVVRFGNVLGSDGSVLPLFQRQLAAGGPLTVTHPEMRRFFMTITEATQLVLQAAVLPEASGRIAVLEMGSQIRILDLAEQLIRLAGRVPRDEVEIVFTGLRPGEKLEEELIGPGETATPTSVDKIRVVERSPAHSRELARRLRYLTLVTARHDESALVRALVALAPGYRPANGLDRLAPRRNGRTTRPSSNGRKPSHGTDHSVRSNGAAHPLHSVERSLAPLASAAPPSGNGRSTRTAS